MLGDSTVQETLKFFSLYSIFLVIPAQFLQVQVDEIVQVVLFGVDASKYEHVAAEECGGVAPPGLHTLFIVHFEAPGVLID